MTLLAAAFLGASLVGDPPMVCLDDNIEFCVSPVSKGQPVPFNGELLTYKLALQMKQRADHCEVELGEQRKADAADIRLQVHTAQKLREIDQEDFRTAMQGCAEEMQKQQKLIDRCEPPWWQKPAFVIPATFVVSSLATTWLVVSVVR